MIARRRPFPRTPDPTPDEIRQRAAAIRATWGPLRLAHSQGFLVDDVPDTDEPAWTPPEISSKFFDRALTKMVD